MPFAQLVIGPPGAGKSTYCDGIQQFFTAIERTCSVINLDPANDRTNYPCAIDIRDLVSLEEIMSEDHLGPNGGVLYALEELDHNFEWLSSQLAALPGSDYIIIDCPGQVELFTHHTSLPSIFHKLEKQLNYRLVVVQLLDSHTLSRPTLYVSSLLLCLRSMLNLPYPLVNVLSKIDNLHNSGTLPFDLEYYTEVRDLDYLLPHLEAEQAGINLSELTSDPTVDAATVMQSIRSGDPRKAERVAKWTKLNEALIQLVDDFGLVSFVPLAVEDKASMASLVRAIDRAGGYVFGADGKGGLSNEEGLFASAMSEGWGQMDVRDVQERWIDRREEFDAAERKQWEEEAKLAGANAVPSAGVVDVRMGEDGRAPTVGELERMGGQGRKKDVGEDDEDLEALQKEFLKKTEQSSGGVKIQRKS